MIFGHPWHGRWTEAGIELPNGTVRPMANPPQGRGAFPGWPAGAWKPSEPAVGDVMVIQIPGVTAPEAPAAHTAAGMSWLPYALISGASHVFYGQRLGYNRWIYLDSENKPWLGELAPIPAHTSVVTAKFTRIQPFGGEGESHQLGVPVAFDSIYETKAVVLDASSTGRGVALGYYRAGDGVGALGAGVVFSGVPGVDLSAVVAPGIYEYSSTVVGANNSTRSAGIIATRFQSTALPVFFSDAPHRLNTGVQLSVSARTVLRGPVTISGVLFAECGALRQELPVEIVQEWDIYGTDRSTTINVLDRSFTFTVHNGILWSEDIPTLSIIRHSNKVAEVFLSWVTLSAPIDYAVGSPVVWSVGIFTPSGFTPTGHDVPSGGDQRYYSYHPVTGELAITNEPMSFV